MGDSSFASYSDFNSEIELSYFLVIPNESEYQAFTDPLTSLPNRRSFEWEAEKIIDRALRYERIFSVAMLDLNGFKRINDSYGHATGDDSLRIITHCMKNSIRKTDFLARYGGDEFFAVLPETDDKG